ncbi:MAG TPA: chorismate mutase [Anaerolineales bacterium]|nr:chorismate mutase [Anaerolineales bacterium]
MPVRGIRGATIAADNTKEAILDSTRELLLAMIAANDIQPEDVASVWLTTSPDLTAEYPALAARALGWLDVALLCAHEMAVPHGMKKVVRILIHLNTDKPAHAIKHIYLGDAASLRPDRPLPVEIAK